jgi:pimeloyl-ACP methyl ester carboxylesterase
MSVPFQINVSKDRVIRGDFFPAKHEAEGLLIICHGFKGFKDWGFFPYTADKLAQHLHVVTFNFSHNGVGEDGMNFSELEKFALDTYSKDLEDLQLLIQKLKDDSLALPYHLGSLPVFLLGHSRGAGVSLLYAFDHPSQINAVISWNGISNVDLLSQEMKDEMRQKGRTFIRNARTKQDMPLDIAILHDIEVNQDRFNILERVKSTKVPIALIQGTEDFKHLQAGSEKLEENNPNIQRHQIANGNHTFNAVHPFKGETEQLTEAINQTTKFIQRILQRG